MKKGSKKLISILTILTVLFTSLFLPNNVTEVNALASNVTGDQILATAMSYGNDGRYNYTNVGTCVGLATRTLNKLGIGHSIVGTHPYDINSPQAGGGSRYNPDVMLQNALNNPQEAKLIWRGKVEELNASVVGNWKNGDLVLQRATDVVPYNGFGHVAFIHKTGNIVDMYGANNAVDGIGDLQLYPTLTRGSSWVYPDAYISVFRLVDDVKPAYATLSATKTADEIINVKITKTDVENGKPLSDVKFDFYRDDVKFASDVVTNENGIASATSKNTFTATSKKYTYCTNYDQLSPEKKQEVIKAGHSKYRAEAEAKANAEAQGLANELANKKHVFKAVETETKKEYWLDPNNNTVSNEGTNGGTVDMALQNLRVKGIIQIDKEDSVTGKLPQGEATLEGAVYGLYARNDILDPADQSVIYPAGDKIAELTTDENAHAEVQALYLGDYFLKEIKASDGYTLDSTEYDVSLTYADQTVPVITKKQTVLEKVKSQAFSIIKISDNGNGEVDKLQGVGFTVKAQKDIDKYGSWEKAPIAKNAQGKEAKVLITDKNGYAVSDELPYGTYVVRETIVPNDHFKVDDFTVTITEDSREPQPWRVLNDEKFKAVISIVKQDVDTGKTVAIKGAEFKIKDLKTNEYVGYWEWNPLPHYVNSWTTDESGTVMIGDKLGAGEYQVEEVKAPNGYVLDVEPVKFTVSSNAAYETLPDGKTPLITVIKKDKAVMGKINVSKTGEALTKFENGKFVYQEKSLAGMTVNVYAKENILDPSNDGTILYKKGTLVDTVTTGTNGTATTKELPLGVYEVREITAPNGYVLEVESQTVELKFKDENTSIVYKDVTFDNDRQKVNASLVKVDEETTIGLSGAEFNLIAKEDIVNADGKVIVKANTVLKKYTSNEDGFIHIDLDLPLNTDYALKEVKAPIGYVLDGTEVLFNTDYQGQDVKTILIEKTKTNEIIRGSIQIMKKDSEDENKVLTNVPFNISSNADMSEVIATAKTDENGIAKFEDMKFGKYYIQEAEQVDGYVINDRIYEVNITTDGELLTVEVENTPTEMIFSKVDETGINELVGAKMQVVSPKTKEIIDEWVSTEEAHTIKYLVEGQTYIFREIIAPYGYEIAEEIEFVAGDGKKVTMKDELILTDIQVNKVDSVTKEAIKHKDFEFTMYADKDCKKAIKTVHANTEDGTATFKDVPYGTYYIKETKAPKGYKLSKEVKEVVVNEELEGVGDIHSFVYENVLLPSKTVSAGDTTNMMMYLVLGSTSLFGLLLGTRKKKHEN